MTDVCEHTSRNQLLAQSLSYANAPIILLSKRMLKTPLYQNMFFRLNDFQFTIQVIYGVSLLHGHFQRGKLLLLLRLLFSLNTDKT